LFVDVLFCGAGLEQRKEVETVCSLYLILFALACSFRSLLQMLPLRLDAAAASDFCLT